jgi:hypothetical protein
VPVAVLHVPAWRVASHGKPLVKRKRKKKKKKEGKPADEDGKILFGSIYRLMIGMQSQLTDTVCA